MSTIPGGKLDADARRQLFEHVEAQVLAKKPVTVTDVFEYLFVKGYFETIEDTTAFITLVQQGYNAPLTAAQLTFQRHMVDKIKLHETEFPTPLAVFEYFDRIGFFFGNQVERAHFLQKAEQIE